MKNKIIKRSIKEHKSHYRKKAQEEIMGFMLVVIMVMVIGLGFMFFFSPKAAEQKDLQLQNIVYAWLSTTAETKGVKELIVDCESGSCQDLENSFIIIDNAITKSGMINTINGYSVNISGDANLLYSKGNLTGNSRTAVVPVSSSTVKLKAWFK